MYCSQCGEENRNDRKFCSNCGAPLRDYTKPREDLLMQEDLDRVKAREEKFNKTIKLIKIFMAITFIFGVGFLLATFFTLGNVQLTLIIISIVWYVVFFSLWIAKNSVTKKFNKQSKE